MSGKETSDVNQIKAGISGERLMEIHALYETAFPAGEKKPFSMIISGQETGLVEILSAEENDTFLGLAIMAKSGDRVLLDYFAIASERRGQGTGSAVLQALKERYQGMRIIIEIESTKCVDDGRTCDPHPKKKLLSPEWLYNAVVLRRSLGN